MNLILKPNRRTSLYWIAALLCVCTIAAYLRVVAVISTEVDTPLRADAREYYFYALNLSEHGIYSRERGTPGMAGSKPRPDNYRPPGYALMLLPLVEFPPTRQMLNEMLLLQSLLSVLTVIVAFVLYRQLMRPGFALAAAVLVAISPHLVSMNTYLLTETLFTFLLTSTILSASIVVRQGNALWAVATGLLFGLTMLVKPTLNYLVLFLLPLLYLYRSRLSAKLVVIMLLGCVLVYGPWLVRNQFGEFDDTSRSLVAGSIHHGMYPGMVYDDRPESYGFPYKFDPRSGELRDLRTVLGELASRASDDPGTYLAWYFAGKPVTFLSWSIVQGMGDVFIYPVTQSPYFGNHLFVTTHRLMHYLHWPLVLLAAFALLAAWVPGARRIFSADDLASTRLVTMVVLYFFLVHMIAFPLPRYAIPIYPLIFGLGMLTLQLLLDRSRHQ